MFTNAQTLGLNANFKDYHTLKILEIMKHSRNLDLIIFNKFKPFHQLNDIYCGIFVIEVLK